MILSSHVCHKGKNYRPDIGYELCYFCVLYYLFFTYRTWCIWKKAGWSRWDLRKKYV